MNADVKVSDVDQKDIEELLMDVEITQLEIDDLQRTITLKNEIIRKMLDQVHALATGKSRKTSQSSRHSHGHIARQKPSSSHRILAQNVDWNVVDVLAHSPDTAAVSSSDKIHEHNGYRINEDGRIFGSEENKQGKEKPDIPAWTSFPDNRWHLVWDLLVTLATMLQYGILYPLVIFFDPDWSVGARGVEGFIIVLLCGDIVLSFFTAFRVRNGDEMGSWQVDHKEIKKNYMAFRFWVDLLATLPFDLLLLATGAPTALMACARVLKLLHVLRLGRLRQRFGENSNFVNPLLQRLLVLSTSFLVSLHWTGCVYWGMSTMEDGLSASDWSPAQEIGEASIFTKYITSLYWATVTIVQIGSTQPSRDADFVFNIVVIIFGMMIYAITVASVTNALKHMDAQGKKMRTRMDQIKTFMAKRGITQETQKGVQDYFQYVQAADTAQNKKMLEGLHSMLQQEVQFQLNQDLIAAVPMFESLSKHCISALVALIEGRVYLPHEIVCLDQQFGYEMFFVSRGSFMVWKIEFKKRKIYKKLKKGDFFGEQALLNRGARRNASVSSVIHGELLVLTEAKLHPLIEQFPTLKSNMRDHAAKAYQTEASKSREPKAKRPGGLKRISLAGSAMMKAALPALPVSPRVKNQDFSSAISPRANSPVSAEEDSQDAQSKSEPIMQTTATGIELTPTGAKPEGPPEGELPADGTVNCPLVESDDASLM